MEQDILGTKAHSDIPIANFMNFSHCLEEQTWVGVISVEVGIEVNLLPALSEALAYHTYMYVVFLLVGIQVA